MWRVVSVVVSILTVSSCSFDTGGLPGAGDDGGGARPDATGSIDADPNAPDADPNAPDAEPSTPDAAAPIDAEVCVTECVTNDTYRDCDAGGTIVDCPLGCGGGTPHCFELDPSNGADIDDLDGVTAGLEIAGDEIATINSDSGQIDIDLVPERIAGTGVISGIGFYVLSNSVSVVAVDFVNMESESYLRVSGTRSLIILSRGDMDIAGFIDIAGGCIFTEDVDCAGPGGGAGANGGIPATGCGAGGNGDGGMGPEAGGGGGAMGENGARGGDGNGGNPGGTAGSAAGCPGASLEPLVGGSGGGTGGAGAGGRGGGGGGALQLSSYTSIDIIGTVQEQAAIWAGGAGGGGAFSTNGGGGGGAGGAILLEAPEVTISNALIGANGGGGGGGVDGENGGPGGLSADRALGGAGAGASDGGLGGADNGAPTTGEEDIDGAGGGGGGRGRVRFNVPQAGLMTGGSTISPDPSQADPDTI